MYKFILFFSCFLPQIASAFCGFYVAKADSSLYNQASQVVMVRHDDKTVLSLMNDYQGDLKDFAMVIPVPEVLRKQQINIASVDLFKQIDSFTAPRLVEYHDKNPCLQIEETMSVGMMRNFAGSAPVKKNVNKDSLGVAVEAEYSIGEFDIVILSAQESEGLERWLHLNDYKIPEGASQTLKPYILQGMKFFVAKVNLKQQSQTGLKFLRPIQFAFETEKFMLPIRLGMINAQGPQDLIIYILSKIGRVEVSNYQTVKLPSNQKIPLFVKNDFSGFYKSMFSRQVEKYAMKAVFTEYFWNMGWCDPCAADPLSPDQLKKLGVFWLKSDRQQPEWVGRRKLPVLVTRLHLRYDSDSFPEDLMFQETTDQTNFQSRYVLHHPWNGEASQCEAARQYFVDLDKRYLEEASNLARMTGWAESQIKAKMQLKQPLDRQLNLPWWQGLWKED